MLLKANKKQLYFIELFVNELSTTRSTAGAWSCLQVATPRREDIISKYSSSHPNGLKSKHFKLVSISKYYLDRQVPQVFSVFKCFLQRQNQSKSKRSKSIPFVQRAGLKQLRTRQPLTLLVESIVYRISDVSVQDNANFVEQLQTQTLSATFIYNHFLLNFVNFMGSCWKLLNWPSCETPSLLHAMRAVYLVFICLREFKRRKDTTTSVISWFWKGSHILVSRAACSSYLPVSLHVAWPPLSCFSCKDPAGSAVCDRFITG